MSYTYNKPDAGDTISSSQSVIKDNFTAIKGLIDVNHLTFGDPSEGKHKYVTMPIQTSLPTVSTTEWGFFVASDGTNPQVYLRNNSSGVIDLTKDITLTSATKANPGWCMLPCGIIMKWGTGSITAGYSGGSGTATDLIYGTGIPTITTLLNANVTVSGTGRLSVGYGGAFSEVAHTVTVYAYSLNSSSNTASFNYLLLGV